MAKMSKNGRGRPPGKATVSPEVFVRAWQQSDSMENLAQQLKVTVTALFSRAHALRKHGVRLKKFRHNRTAYTPERLQALRELAESLALEKGRQ